MSQTDLMDNVGVAEQYGLSTTLELNYVAGAGKAAMKKIGTANDLFMVDARKLKIKEGFNTRIKDATYWEKVEKLALSMKENGFYRDKPLACIVAKEGGEDVIYVVEGGRRRDAVLMLMSWMKPEDADLFRVPAVIKDRETSEVDLVYGLAQGNNAEPFRPYEMAVLVKRLKQVYGQTEQQILTKLDGIVSASYLNHLLIVSGAPRKIADLIISEKLSVTQAAQLMLKHGSDAVSILEQAEANAKAEGKEKITNRFMPGKRLEAALKKEAGELYKSAKQVMEDPGFAGLSEGTRALLEDLMKDLAKAEDAQLPLDQANDANMGDEAAQVA